jgi:2-methylcitrate dehydratase PrpD
VIAAALAAEGYVGDDDILDIDPGFLRGQGYLAGDAAAMMAGLGDRWHIVDTRLKAYPANAFVNVVLAEVADFARQHPLRASDIGAIRVYLVPGTSGTRFFNDPLRNVPNDHLAPLHGAFNIPHLVSLAILGYAPGPDWFGPEVLDDADVVAVSARVHTVVPGPEQPDADARAGSVVIELRDERKLLNTQVDEGRPPRPDWQFVTQKLSTYCAGILEPRQQSDLLRLMQELESVDDVARRLSPLLAVR